MRISDWSSDVCSSDLLRAYALVLGHGLDAEPPHKLFEILSGEWLAQVGPALQFFGQDRGVIAGRQGERNVPCLEFFRNGKDILSVDVYVQDGGVQRLVARDRKSTRLNSSH